MSSSEFIKSGAGNLAAGQSHPQLVPVSSILAQFGVELRALAASVDAVEMAAEYLSDVSQPHDERAVIAMQNLDLIRQSLEALAVFAARLSGNVPSNLQVEPAELTHLLTLDALARRLRLESNCAGGAAAVLGCGVEFFD